MIEKKPISMNFATSSVTTFEDKNPSFQVLTLDTKTMLPVEMETYYLDIEKANKDDNPTWELFHKATEAFGLEDFSPKSFRNFAERVYSDEDLAKKYNDDRYINGPGPENNPCDGFECRRNWYCNLIAGDYEEFASC